MSSIDDVRVESVDRVVRGAHGLGEDQGAVGVLDRRREAAEQLVLPLVCATI